jgi:hypothetical protein
VDAHHPRYIHAGYAGSWIVKKNLIENVENISFGLQAGYFDFDAFAFRGNSGALLAAPLAVKMEKSLILVRKTKDTSHSGLLVEGDLGARRYIIVDDMICSGDTVRAIISGIHKVWEYEADTDRQRWAAIADTSNLTLPGTAPLCVGIVEASLHCGTPRFSMIRSPQQFQVGLGVPAFIPPDDFPRRYFV